MVKYCYILHSLNGTTKLKILIQSPNKGSLVMLGFEHMAILFETQSIHHWTTTTISISLHWFNWFLHCIDCCCGGSVVQFRRLDFQFPELAWLDKPLNLQFNFILHQPNELCLLMCYFTVYNIKILLKYVLQMFTHIFTVLYGQPKRLVNCKLYYFFYVTYSTLLSNIKIKSHFA